MCSGVVRYCRGCVLLLVSLLTLCACGGGDEETKQNLLLTLSPTETRELESTGETERAEDIVNGFRFEPCDEMVYCVG